MSRLRRVGAVELGAQRPFPLTLRKRLPTRAEHRTLSTAVGSTSELTMLVYRRIVGSEIELDTNGQEA